MEQEPAWQQQQRHAELVARWGKPEAADRRTVLGLLHAAGAAAALTPHDVCAFRYPSMEAAEAFAEANWTHHGYPSHFTATADGVFGVVDLRQTLRPAEVPPS